MSNQSLPKNSPEIEVTIISTILSPEKAINTGMHLARREIEYTLADLGNGKWKVTLIRGKVGDLLSIIKTTTSVKIAHDSIPPDSVDIDVDF